jgi:hypothetical protein
VLKQDAFLLLPHLLAWGSSILAASSVHLPTAPNYVRMRIALGDGATVARLTLDQLIEVRVLVSQPYRPPLSMEAGFCIAMIVQQR